MKARCEK